MGIVVVASLAACAVAKPPAVTITAELPANQLARKLGESFHLLAQR
jgi:hypothetical protein